MSAVVFKYVMIALYVGLTFGLSWVGMKKTKTFSGFSVGNRDMGPFLIGITMAASISSTATFVINPGFVYTDGLSAFIHYAVAAPLGIIFALTLLSKRFRQTGEQKGSLTIPHWIYHRYESRMLSLFFALINLLSITFIVLILVGCSMIMGGLLDISQKLALVMILLFVFGYVLMGGTYAHAYTNFMQGLMMIFITLFLVISGYIWMEGDFVSNMQAISYNFSSMVNPSSKLYYNFFSVFVSGFVITAALMFQPHIFTKVLYLKNDKDVTKFLLTTFIVGIIFAMMLMLGFYARFSGLEVSSQDAVVGTYINHVFATASWWGPYVLVFISITLLAAGMSTLDGILVSLSAMVVNDIYAPLRQNQNISSKEALLISRLVLVGIGLIAFILAWNPPLLVGLFAQKGVYGLASASFVPIIAGVLLKKHLPLWIISTSAVIGLFGHLFLNLSGLMPNPAVSSTVAILTSSFFTLVAFFLNRSIPKKYTKSR